MPPQHVRIHYLQHVSFEGPGHVAIWAQAKGHPLSSTRFFLDDPLPDISEFDWLVIMGGPMGVLDEGQCPWMSREKELIVEAIAGGKVVIGICLGAQLIAHALGAEVGPNSRREIGWFPVRFHADAALLGLSVDNFPELTVFHWHGDTFGLPPDALSLASSEACRNQGFLYNGRVVGLQFHLEVTEKSIAAMVEADDNIASGGEGVSGGGEGMGKGSGDGDEEEDVSGRFIQSRAEILAGNRHIPDANRCLELLLDSLVTHH